MQGTESSQFLSPHYPTSLLHSLPTGHFSYLQLPITVQSPSSPYGSSVSDTEREDIGKQREKWAKVVLVTGLIMLAVAWLGLSGHVLILKKTIHKGKWAVWGIGVGMCGMIVVAGLLAVRAGVKKTSSSALLYLRLLVLLTITFVIALMLSSMLRMKTDSHKWKHQKLRSLQTLPPPAASIPPPGYQSTKDRMDRDNKDESKHWRKKAAGEALLMGMFLLVLGVMGIFVGCVLCAVRLLKAARQYECLYATYDQMAAFSYIQMATVQAAPVAPQRIRYPQVD